MKLPTYFYMAHWRARTIRSLQSDQSRGEESSQITPQAQQGLDECQDYCESMYPDNAIEQLECYKRECWS